MAKGQQRSNREIKKPKKDKPKPAAAASSLGASQSKTSAALRPAGSKK